ncbi:MAG: NosD domain-containing protein, partial [Candidatus Micrarchaeota archaeon]
MRKVVLQLVAILMLGGLAFSTTNVTGCQALNNATDTSYILVNNVVGANISATPATGFGCIKLNYSNVVFDCNGYNITNNISGASDRYGIVLTRVANVIVKNCPGISNYTYGDNDYAGIYSYQSNRSQFINNTVFNNFDGFRFYGGSRNNLSGNVAWNNSVGFHLLSSTSNNTLTNNTAFNNSVVGDDSIGFYLSGTTGNNLSNNSAYGNYVGFRIESSSDNQLTNNSAQENAQQDLNVIVSSDIDCNNTFDNMTGSGGRPINYTNATVSWSGLDVSELILCNADNSTLSNITVRGSDTIRNNYLQLLRVENTTITDSNSSGNYYGIYLLSSSNNSVSGSVAFDDYAGFSVGGGGNNSLFNNTAGLATGWGGFYLSGSRGNNLTNNTAYNNSEGFRLGSADNNLLANNTVFGSVSVFTGGFYLQDASGNQFINNTARNNTNGFKLDLNSDNNFFIGNTVYNNSQDGFLLNLWGLIGTIDSGNNFTNNTIFNNSRTGVNVMGANRTFLTGDHFYNNIVDLRMNSTAPLRIYNLSAVIFDSPLGNFTNYTNISINDTSTVASIYTFNWSAQPAALPVLRDSFADKYLNISRSGTNTLDSVYWHWQDSELNISNNESRFALYKYSGSGVWSAQNTTPDTASNTLSLANLNPASVYAILENIAVPCPVYTSPGSYQLNQSYFGASNDVSEISPGALACIKIASSDVIFDCDGFNITNDGTTGTTMGIALNGSLTNVTVKNCPRISNYLYGIYVYQSNNTVFTNNTAYNNSLYGFYLYSSSNNTLTNNIAFNNSYGVYLYSSSNNNLTNNSAYNNSNRGFYLSSSFSNNFTNNTAYSNTQYGFRLDSSSSNNFTNNSAYRNSYGFTLYSSSSNNFTNNTAYNNSFYGFYLSSSSNNNLTSNTAYNNTQ